VSIHAEAYRVSDEEKISEQTAVLAIGDLTTVPVVFEAFGQRVRDAFPAPRPATPKPEPVLAPATPPVVAAPAPSPPPSRVPVLISAGLALAFGGAGGFFAATGLDEKSQLERRDSMGAATIMRSQAEALAASANTRFTIALICGITALALAVLAGVLFGVSA
jgi:hypothetical protein